MNGSRLGRAFGLVVFAAVVSSQGGRGEDGQAVSVEPAELTKRADLVGREVVVDDRVSRFQYHPETGFDQIFLTRAPEVSFEIPRRLRPTQNPTVIGVKIRGLLRHDDGRWWVDVRSYEPLPADLDRLNRAVAVLPRSDAESRNAWAQWAEQRGKAFKDPVLLKRAREVVAEAIRAEAEKPPGPDPAAHWLALADRARSRNVPEPEPSAQAHRGFRAALATAKSADDLKTLAAKIERFFPDAAKPLPGAADLSRWEKPYSNAPADAYRTAPADVRQALDHRLRADTLQRYLERRAAESPKALLSLAEEAERLVPDRPDLARAFLEKGLATAGSEVGSLRQNEVEALAKLYRDRLHQPEKARALYLTWLNDQKDHRLSARDADGRIALADQYERLLDDRATAVALLRDASAIDPESREVADAFRRRGFRKLNGEWVEGAHSAAPAAPSPDPVTAVASADPAATAAPRSESLRGSTPGEVRARLGGPPNRKTWVASQGQLIEQWVYFGPRLDQYVNILHKTGDPQPRVVSYYSLPHDPGARPSTP